MFAILTIMLARGRKVKRILFMISRRSHKMLRWTRREADMPLDRITAALLADFSREYDLDSLPEDERFEHLACHLVVKRHFGQTFSTADILTGSATGIDGIAVIVNGTLVEDVEALKQLADDSDYLEATFVLVQADRGPHFDAGKLGTFAFAVKDFFAEEPQLARAREIEDAAAIMSAVYDQQGKFKRGNPTCRMYYVTTGKLAGDSTLEARRAIEEGDVRSTDLFKTVSLELMGRQELQELYRQSKNAASRTFPFPSSVAVPDIEGVREAHIGLIPAPTLIGVLTDDNGEMLDSIFYDNVRDWQGDNDVNREIKATLGSPAKARFVLMNNGVTIIARELQRTGDRFHIEDYQVVNGCQTSHVIVSQKDALDASVMIPLRLIATQDKEITSAIIRATNRQTEVKEEQFFALTTFPKELEEFFGTFEPPHRLYYERRSKQYDRLSIEKTRIVTQANLLRAFAAMFLEDPHGTTRSARSLRDKMGREVFAKDHRLELYYLTAYAAYLLEYRFRNYRIATAYKPARFHILLAVRLLANPEPLPPMNSRDMKRYCDGIIDILRDGSQADDLFGRAVAAVDAVAGGNLNRDTIRTLPFTEALMAQCGAPRKPRSGATAQEGDRAERQKTGEKRRSADIELSALAREPWR
jgi:hypothetical protein